ncbi:C6 zinc finger domain-containing protein [Fusarium oxysporum f. sp. phaseoli]
MIIADYVASADDTGNRQEDSTKSRLHTNVIPTMRRSSAVEISKLGRLAFPTQGLDGYQDQLPGYHPAMAASTLLADPRTILLTRAFAKAAVHHLDVIDQIRNGDTRYSGYKFEGWIEAENHLENCLGALRLLGRTSELSRDVADLLDSRRGCPGSI